MDDLLADAGRFFLFDGLFQTFVGIEQLHTAEGYQQFFLATQLAVAGQLLQSPIDVAAVAGFAGGVEQGAVLTGEVTSSQERQTAFTTMMKVALDVAVAMENK